jgi:hypothetical protein
MNIIGSIWGGHILGVLSFCSLSVQHQDCLASASGEQASRDNNFSIELSAGIAIRRRARRRLDSDNMEAAGQIQELVAWCLDEGDALIRCASR